MIPLITIEEFGAEQILKTYIEIWFRRTNCLEVYMGYGCFGSDRTRKPEVLIAFKDWCTGDSSYVSFRFVSEHWPVTDAQRREFCLQIQATIGLHVDCLVMLIRGLTFGRLHENRS